MTEKTAHSQIETNARRYEPAAEHFEGRTIMVTGATGGIGRALAIALVELGATVILHGRNARKLDGLHSELLGRGPETTVAPLDLERAQGDDYIALSDAIEERYGRLDGLVHNASVLGDRSPIAHYDIGLWQRVMHVNTTAPFILTRCLLPLLEAANDASIIATSSGVGNHARAHWGAYCVSKFGLEALAGILAEENENGTIRCNIVNPGRTKTSMRRKAYPGEDPDTLPEPTTVLAPFLFLLGSASRGITGARIDVQDY